jgi:antitoxin HicB
MNKREKALEKFRNNPRNVRYEELEALLLYLGFEKRQENTNHLVFSIQGHLPITVPRKRPFLKHEYVKNDIQAIDELDLMDDDLRLTMNNRSVDEYLALPYTIEVIRDTDLENPGWVARVLELPGCITQADTLDELYEMIEDAMRGWIEVALEDGLAIPEPRTIESYSGKFVVRVPKSLHRELVEVAEEEGVSLNMYITTALGRAVGHRVNVSAVEIVDYHT